MSLTRCDVIVFAASTEGVPQFVTFAYLDHVSPEELAAVLPELPIIRPDMVPLIGPGAAWRLNFAYAPGPAFVDSVVAARGIGAAMFMFLLVEEHGEGAALALLDSLRPAFPAATVVVLDEMIELLTCGEIS